jgi:3-oxoacyl-[acyl-carrier-protein] synthase II
VNAREGRFDVAVTGVGLVTPAGIGVAENWRTVCAGRSTARRDTRLAGLPVDFSCRADGFDPDAVLGRRLTSRIDRHVQLALATTREALRDAALDPAGWDGQRVGVVFGCGLGGMTVWEAEHTKLLRDGPRRVSPRLIPAGAGNMVAGEIAIDCGATGPNFVTATACASGATAIGMGRELLRSGLCDVVLTGGTDANICALVVTPFARMGALSQRTDDPASASRPFDVDRDGFVIGEGAATLVLERAADAAARRAPVRALLSGFGATADAWHPTAPDPEGRGMARAVRAALRDAGVGADEVDHVNAHGTSTPLNDSIEARTMSRVLGKRPVLTSTKGVTGHTLGAAGAVEAVYTVLAMQDASIPPTANLECLDPEIDMDIVVDRPRSHGIDVAISNSFGFGGQNAVLLFTRP